ncbi:hypothetical protein [Nonomuraea sp. NPDC049158]|uniref:hypothetical protein n=1 Tax=Nonomuraea sp. NPDC049158 TaxID=3155649 RepID=UPI0033ECEF4A
MPIPVQAATSAEEIAERLRSRVDDDVHRRPENMSLTIAPDGMNLDVPLLFSCRPDRGLDALPPEGVPAYTGQIRAPEVSSALDVRFWITSPGKASRLVREARHGAEDCARRPRSPYSGSDLADFDRWGWHGVQAAAKEEEFIKDSDPDILSTIVAARGGLLAEVSWRAMDPHVLPLSQETAAASVLAAVGGDPDSPAPAGASPRSVLGVMAAALPAPSAYGKNMKAWPTFDPEQDTLCPSAGFDQNVYGGAPTIRRRLAGEVSIRTDVLLLPDEQAAEQARTRPLTWSDWVNCETEDKSHVRGSHVVRPLTTGPWTGQVETFLIRRRDLSSRAAQHLVANVSVAVRHGTTMVYLRWQGPAGTDRTAALRRGRAALTRTLALLPAAG